MSNETHKILSEAGYTNRQDYGQIAREAAKLTKNKSLSKEDLLAEMQRKFGEAPCKQKMLDKPQPFAMFGTPGVDFDYGAIEQMRKVLSIPVSVNGAMMPDRGHVGLWDGQLAAVARAGYDVSPGFVGH